MKDIRAFGGWIGGIAGWFLAAQSGSDLVHLDCTRANDVPMALIGIAGALLAIMGGLLSLRIWQTPGDLSRPNEGMRRFIAGTGAIAAGIFLLVIIFQTISSFIIPQCHA